MEFNQNKTQWKGVVFFFIYIFCVVYLLMSNNRFLYSHIELRLALDGEQSETIAPLPRPEHQKPSPAKGGSTFWQRGTPERTGHDISGQQRDKEFIPVWQKTLFNQEEASEIQGYALDDTGFYVTSNNMWAYAYTNEGDVKWKYHFPHDGEATTLWSPVLDEGLVYLSTSNGHVVALDKKNGQVQWKLILAKEILNSPFILNSDELIFAVFPLQDEIRRLELNPEAKDSSRKSILPPAVYRLLRLNKSNGTMKGYSDSFVVKGRIGLTLSQENKQIIVTSDNKLHILSAEDFKLLSSQTLPDAIEGQAVVAEGHAFLALRSGKIQSWDITKKAKFEWEVDLTSAPMSPPTYIPIFQQLAIITADNQLHMIDFKKAKHLWLFPIENRNPGYEIIATRLQGRVMEKFNLKWQKRGWTAWAPCSEGRLCIYNPEKGQLIARIPVRGGVVSPPLFVGKSFYLLSKEVSADKTKKYLLTHYLDEESYRKKPKATQEAATAQTDGL
ncbi:MAG: PQQ-binding-like beta-propeller repeat protein [Bdellovibrionales bacterium]|nr:PQQ-binding-like beta-propeller repeat protein [Bdellovibrionales bacterium]